MPKIQAMLNEFNDAPVIGLEFILEIVNDVSTNPPPSYHCLLCNKSLESAGLISDVISAEHRIAYLVSKPSLVVR